MDKPTHKMENGKRIELKEEECACIMKEWEENMKKDQQKILDIQAREQMKKDLMNKICSSTGITGEQFNILFN